MSNPSKGPMIIKGVSNGIVNTGTAGNITNNVVHNSFGNEESLRVLLKDLRMAIPQLNLTPAAKLLMEQELKCVEEETNAPKPKPEWIQRALSGIRGVLMGVAGNTAYAGLVALIHSVESFLP